MFQDSIPVICYHRIDKSDSISPEIFETHLRYLQKAGYQSIGQMDLRDHLSGAKRLQGKHVLLTFDDGYQDFYHHAYPLLKKYKTRALVFLIGSHVVSDPGRSFPDPPPDYDRLHRMASEKNFSGFLSLEQIREMQASGMVEFGGHTQTHGISLVSSQISGAYAGEQLKWYVPADLNLTEGRPLFQMAPNLYGPRFVPDREFVKRYTQLLNGDGLTAEETAVRLQLLPRGVMEPEADWQQRLQTEIVEARNLLEGMLEQPVISFCWPWGIEGEEARETALVAGYELLFTLQRGSNSRPEDAACIKRFSARRKGAFWLFSRLLVFNNRFLAAYYDRKQRQQNPYLPYS
ncbi:polysaccharide deacetylase family protein [bacterium]|nr:polysaccharide deacetylase family protein [bacterium]